LFTEKKMTNGDCGCLFVEEKVQGAVDMGGHGQSSVRDSLNTNSLCIAIARIWKGKGKSGEGRRRG